MAKQAQGDCVKVGGPPKLWASFTLPLRPPQTRKPSKHNTHTHGTEPLRNTSSPVARVSRSHPPHRDAGSPRYLQLAAKACVQIWGTPASFSPFLRTGHHMSEIIYGKSRASKKGNCMSQRSAKLRLLARSCNARFGRTPQHLSTTWLV